MLTVGIYTNLYKKNLAKVAKDLIKWFEEQNFSVLLPSDVADSLSMPHLAADLKDIVKTIDIAVTLGGDGTLLNVAKQVAFYKIPILGINMGNLGFLTEIELSDLYTDLAYLKTQNYNIDIRMMLDAHVYRGSKVLKRFLALNDVVVTKGPFARLIRLKTYASDSYIDTYPADGIIISTPTGSTAYSLSAGGPIINPDMSLLLLTPICPHTLQSRSIILSEDDIIRVEFLAEHPEVLLTVDGQQGYKLQPGDQVIVKKSNLSTRLIRLKKRSFYDVLRKKLREK